VILSSRKARCRVIGTVRQADLLCLTLMERNYLDMTIHKLEFGSGKVQFRATVSPPKHSESSILHCHVFRLGNLPASICKSARNTKSTSPQVTLSWGLLETMGTNGFFLKSAGTCWVSLKPDFSFQELGKHLVGSPSHLSELSHHLPSVCLCPNLPLVQRCKSC
jgi:hypothetical protein